MKTVVQRGAAAAVLGLALLFAGVAGCGAGGGAKLPTVPVSGTVTLDGKPLEGATVGFIPNDGMNGKPANGVTDATGTFQLKTLSGGANLSVGALPGDYKVSIVKAAAAGGSSMPGMGQTGSTEEQKAMGAPGAANSDAPASEVPAIYGDPANSGLTATVKASGNEPLKFDLKAK